MIRKILFSKRIWLALSFIGINPTSVQEKNTLFSWKGSVALSGFYDPNAYRLKSKGRFSYPYKIHDKSLSIKKKEHSPSQWNSYKFDQNIYQNLCAQGFPPNCVQKILSFLKTQRLCNKGDLLSFCLSANPKNPKSKICSIVLQKVGKKIEFSFSENAKQLPGRTPLHTPINNNGFLNPIPHGGAISSRFGPRGGRLHKGLDIRAPKGTPIVSCASGTITFCGYGRGFGYYIKISHGNGYETLYAHMDSFSQGMRRGRCVKAGECIGGVGKSGRATGPHLHLEVHKNNRPINPEFFLKKKNMTMNFPSTSMSPTIQAGHTAQQKKKSKNVFLNLKIKKKKDQKKMAFKSRSRLLLKKKANAFVERGVQTKRVKKILKRQ